MENKNGKKTINTVIYLLLAAMLVCVVFVSVYTVASKKNPATELPDRGRVTEKATPSTDTTAPSIDRKPIVTDKNLPETTPVKPEETKIPETQANKPEKTDSISVGGLAATEDDERPASTESRYFTLPVDGAVSKEFEIDIPVWSLTMDDYRAHTGVDLAAELGSPVLSASSGIVCRVWNDPMMGHSIMIDHGDGIYTTYMNLAEPSSVAVGTKIGVGQSIGAVGESALVEIAEEPHLHLEMKVNGKFVDPLEFIPISSSGFEE